MSGLSNREQLEYLLKRILFFYYKKNQKDGERLVSGRRTDAPLILHS